MKNITVLTSTSPLSAHHHYHSAKNTSKAQSQSYIGVIPQHDSNPRLNTSFSGNVQLPPVAELHQRRQHIRTAGGNRKSSIPYNEKYQQGLFGSLVGYNLGMQSNPSLRQESEYSYIDDKLALAKTYLGNGSSVNLPASTRAGTNQSPFRNGSRVLGSECPSKKFSNNLIGRENFSWMGSTSQLGDFRQIFEDKPRSKSKRPVVLSLKKKRPISKDNDPSQIVSAIKRRKVVINPRQHAGTAYDPVVEKRPRLKKKMKSNRTPKYSSNISTQRQLHDSIRNGQSENASILPPTSPDYLRESQFSPFKDTSVVSTERFENSKSPIDLNTWSMNQGVKMNQTADLHSNRVILGSEKEDYSPINPFQLPGRIKQFQKLMTTSRKKQRTPSKRALSSRLKSHKLTNKPSVMTDLSEVYDTGRSNSHKSSKFERNGRQLMSSPLSNLFSPLGGGGGVRLVLGSERMRLQTPSCSSKRAHFLRQARMSEEEMSYLTAEERQEVQRQQKKLFLLRQRELEQADKKVREVMTDHLHLQRDLATYESYASEALDAHIFIRELQEEMVELVKPIVGPIDELHEVSMLREGAILEVDHQQETIRDSRLEQNIAAGFQLIREFIQHPHGHCEEMKKAFELNLEEMQSVKRVQTEVSGIFTCIELLDSKLALRISTGLKIESSVIQIPESFRAMSIGKLLSHLQYEVITSQGQSQVRAGFVEHHDKNTRRLNCLVWLPYNLAEIKDSAQFSFSRRRGSSEKSQGSQVFEEVEIQSQGKREDGSVSVEVKEETEEEEESVSKESRTAQVQDWTFNNDCAESVFLCKAEADIPRYDETEAYHENEVDIRITIGWSKHLPRDKINEFQVSLGEELIRSYGTSNSKLAECLTDHIALSKFLQY